MKRIFYSPLVRLSLLLVSFYFVWNYWSFLTMLGWVIFMVLYYEKAVEWQKNQKNEMK
jgi:hypothetical protein